MPIFVIALSSLSTIVGAETDIKNDLISSLHDMGYENVVTSNCIIAFSYRPEPKASNGFTKYYTRIFDLEYLKEFSNSSVEKVQDGQNFFFRFHTRLNSDYPLRLLHLNRFTKWLWDNYPGAHWQNVRLSIHRSSLPEIEAELAKRIPNLAQLNRWIFITEYGQITEADDFFQISWSEEKPLLEFLEALKNYAREKDCDIEN